MAVIFLDRDGVINRFPGFGSYVTRWEDFVFLPNAIRALANLKKAGHALYVVSNQGCVSRGIMTSGGLAELTDHMLREIERGGGSLDGVFYCEHQTSDNCECKKPSTLLLRKALSGSAARGPMYLIGDADVDIEAGKNFGCLTVLVLSGRTSPGEERSLPVKPDVVKKDLWEAACWILENKS